RPPLLAIAAKAGLLVPVLEPRRGLEPLTYRLQIGCAANCATRARVASKESNTKTIRRGGSPSVWMARHPMARRSGFQLYGFAIEGGERIWKERDRHLLRSGGIADSSGIPQHWRPH